ncbi:hypothetical protein P389DRAFT_21288 [Cystobasidium minutum MCA 4210]|uniref:uncharacterized protein n=1 Tax=Cystobasidium minutum MCA 4210 TaxID=1397322 RepID=UPI0034CE424C|eukprot:jgi/Rhomi1/21288/CE21287_727
MPVLEVDDAFRSVTAFADSTVQFFRRRAELEASYLDGLEKILAKQEESDRKAEALFGESSLLAAWSEVKATAYAELAERKQLVLALNKSVIDPLIQFRDQKDRQRRRIKEELANTASEHNDYKSHTLRLKRVYQRKSEEVRNLSAVSEVNSPPAAGTSSSSTARDGAAHHSQGSSSSHHGHSASSPGSRSGAGGQGTPLTPHVSSTSGHDVLISGATSTVLRDAHSPPPVNNAAMHAIKSSRTQLNNLINRLGTAASSSKTYYSDKDSNNLKPSILQQTKLSKIKREAEESDANYRSALHHLETLRMQRERVSKASLASLHEFAFELSSTCKSIFVQYCDAWAGKARQTEMVCERAKNATYAISPEQDVNSFNRAAKVNVFFEEPLPYENYHVGVSYSLIIGVSLSEYSASNDGVLVPLTVQRAILEIDSRGLDVEGIYRIPGKMALIQQVVQEIEQDEFAFEFDPERHDVHTVAGVLKLYLRQLPEALLPIDSKEREAISSASEEDAFKMLSKKLRKLPPSHQATAKMLVAHFARVLNHAAANKMSPQALALCLNPVLFTEETSLSAFAQGHKDRCLEFLIAHRQELFNGLPILDTVNNPYRNNRLSEGSSAAMDDDDDDDIPFRRSQESVKLSSSAGSPTRPSLLGPTGSGLHLDTRALQVPPRSSSFQGPSSGEPTPIVPNGPPLPDVASFKTANDSQLEYLSAPMSLSQSRSSNVSSATSDSDTYKGSPRASAAADMMPAHLSAAQISSTSNAEVVPKRTLSQRAKVGSASIAAAVKNLARSRSGSNSYSHSSGSSHQGSHPPTPLHHSNLPPTAVLAAPSSWQHPPGAISPLRETYSPEQRSASSSNESSMVVPPLLPSRPVTSGSEQLQTNSSFDTLPAGAAPLVARASSFTASSPPSALPTPEQGLHRPASNPLFAEPQGIESLALVDPDSVFETYHEAEKERADSSKRRAATD